jgi:thiamine biosynthesis lipoprotein
MRVILSSFAVTLATALAAASPCSAAGPLVSLSGRSMGTTYSIKYSDDGSIDHAKLAAAVEQRLAEIDERMSTYRDDSELSRFRISPANQWFAVSTETLQVTQLAIEISKATDGAFDPTVMPLVELWRFGPSTRPVAFVPPTEEAIAETLKRVGYEKLQVRDEPPALMKSVAGLSLDLSAIAKGHGVDEVVRIISSFGAERVLVEIGGEVRVVSGKTDKDPWRIGIEKPIVDRRELEAVAAIRDQSMATSGNYRNFFERDGIRYSHTIDPRTGWPTQHRLGSVSVISESCAKADALATAVLVMGAEAGAAWTQQQGVTAIFLTNSDAGIQRKQTGPFPLAAVLAAEAALPQTNNQKTSNHFLVVVLLSITIFGIAIIGMAVGVIISNRCLKGSCGGLAAMPGADGKTGCETCQNRSPECESEVQRGEGEAPSANP